MIFPNPRGGVESTPIDGADTGTISFAPRGDVESMPMDGVDTAHLQTPWRNTW